MQRPRSAGGRVSFKHVGNCTHGHAGPRRRGPPRRQAERTEASGEADSHLRRSGRRTLPGWLGTGRVAGRAETSARRQEAIDGGGGLAGERAVLDAQEAEGQPSSEPRPVRALPPTAATVYQRVTSASPPRLARLSAQVTGPGVFQIGGPLCRFVRSLCQEALDNRSRWDTIRTGLLGNTRVMEQRGLR